MPDEEEKPTQEARAPAPKTDLSKLRIAKKAYVFDVRKKFAASRNFLLKKKAETPAENLRQQIDSLLSKKKPLGSGNAEKERRDAALAAAAAAKPAPSAKSSMLIAAAAVALVLVLASAAFVLLSLSPRQAPAELPASNLFSGSYSSKMEKTDMLSYAHGDTYGRTPYFLIGYFAENLSSLNYSFKILQQKPATQVFLLDYAKDGADSFPVFRQELFEGLQSAGIPVSEIDVEHLASLPAGATVLVPTGQMPKELLGIGNQFDYKDLLGRGSNIVYIGYPFDESALDKNGLTQKVNGSEITFSRSKPASSEGFSLFDAQYVAAPNGGGMTGAGQLYGSVSVIKYGQGTMLLLPQNLDGGWRSDGVAAAKDVVRLIREERWLAPLSETSVQVPLSKSQAPISVFMPSIDSDSGYVEFVEDATDLNGIGSRSIRVFSIEKTQKGEMRSHDPVAVPFYISNQKTRLSIEMREDNPALVKLYVRLYKNGAMLQEDELELGLTNPTLDKPKDMQVDAEPGRYVVRVEDKAGKVYAATSLDVADMDVEVNRTVWQTGKFSFFLSSAGQPVSPRSLTVSLDGRAKRDYYPSSYSYDSGRTAIAYDYGTGVSPGNHTFAFAIGSRSKALSLEYRPSKNFWENPWVLILGGISLLVFGIGVILRRPEVLRYGLDIPDFPPLSTIKIPVKRQTVLEIFDSVNASYSWQYMPLRTDELKNGFRRLTYNGKPILVGDFNLDRILARLKEEGEAKEELGYWGLSSWEAASRHSILYLAIYRILRNVFVNNAVKFSRLDAMPDCDLKAIAGKEEIYLHIMQEPAEKVVHKALATAKRGTTIIVFGSEEERDAFANSLTSTSKLAVALKMEVNSGNIMLLPVKQAISSYLKGVVK